MCSLSVRRTTRQLSTLDETSKQRFGDTCWRRYLAAGGLDGLDDHTCCATTPFSLRRESRRNLSLTDKIRRARQFTPPNRAPVASQRGILSTQRRVNCSLVMCRCDVIYQIVLVKS
jgi:hypothetical protein